MFSLDILEPEMVVLLTYFLLHSINYFLLGNFDEKCWFVGEKILLMFAWKYVLTYTYWLQNAVSVLYF